jgi:PAS domain S-box-containing protein
MNNMNMESVFIKELDNIVESVCDDLLITDGDGVILKASQSFGETYGIKPAEMIGRNVSDMEGEGYFNPSVTKMVISSKEKVTTTQKNKNGRDIIVTAIPVFDDGKLVFVISFCRDITDYMALQHQYENLENEVRHYKEELRLLKCKSGEDYGVVAESDSTIRIIKTIDQIADFDATVLLTGNSGVGKSLFARLIHDKSSRKNNPFVEISCGAIPNNLLESELFGYEPGSFTGANRSGKKGLVEHAQNGTLFLDEVSELPLDLQVKVLNVVQNKKFMPVGSGKEVQVDFRLIAATNKNLEDLVHAGLFREDLYYRLKVIPINIPPFKERKEDLLHLCIFFIDQFNAEYKLAKSLSYQVTEVFRKYDWPGNIRELGNLIERLVLTSETDRIGLECLPEEMQYLESHIEGSEDSLPMAVDKLERRLVRKAYKETGTTTGVARLLGISQPTTVRKIKKYVED